MANHINDISKDSPNYVLRLVKLWDQKHPHTAWIVKRGKLEILVNGKVIKGATFMVKEKK